VGLDKDHEAIVQLLVEKGAALDLQDINGQTPLSLAVDYGHKPVVQLLVEKGAALDVVDTKGVNGSATSAFG
jgi:ankyrin repeat protein